MAERPVFVVENDKVRVRIVKFVWVPGQALTQRQKCIRNLHRAWSEETGQPSSKILEVSTKSESSLGRALSAFNLTLPVKCSNGKEGTASLESVFQASKVFENGGPFEALMFAKPRDAKRDPRLKSSGRLIAFRFDDTEWDVKEPPSTVFYDWLYCKALVAQRAIVDQLLREGFKAFTDIEFNPVKSINCQARSAALVVALRGMFSFDDLRKLVQDTKEFELVHNEIMQSDADWLLTPQKATQDAVDCRTADLSSNSVKEQLRDDPVQAEPPKKRKNRRQQSQGAKAAKKGQSAEPSTASASSKPKRKQRKADNQLSLELNTPAVAEVTLSEPPSASA